MRRAARVALVVVLLAGGLGVLPRLASGAFAGPKVFGQVPTPLLSDLIGRPSPTPSHGGGGEDPTDPGDPGDPGGEKGDGRGDNKNKAGNKKGKKGENAGRKGRKGKRGRKNLIPPIFTPSIPGAYSTDELMTIAAHLRSLGWTAEEVVNEVFPPFIIAGEATWVDTWGAPRYGPGPLVRSHEGQDVFCDYGDPVLAPVAGVLSMSDGGLGGITSRVHLSDGSYWYLTHLSDWNREQFVTGDQVQEGDVIGYCGNSGNAETTPPHVHFGWYQPSGKAKDPMRQLIAWLEEAERRAANLIALVESQRQARLPILTKQRRFGDAFTPDRSALGLASGESLWAAGRVPEAGAFALASAALQAALAAEGFVSESIPIPSGGAGTQGDHGDGTLDPNSTLARLLDRRFAQSDNESGD